MNNRGFSLVEILAVIALIGVLSGIAIGAVQRYMSNAREQSINTLASSSLAAADEYLIDHPNTKEVSFDELLEEGYINNIDSPKGNSKCKGRVKFTKIQGEKKSSLSSYKSNVYLCCDGENLAYEYPGGKKNDTVSCKSESYDVSEITEIKVLNVYPTDAAKNNLYNWMYNKEHGDERIKVTPVLIDDFNSNPKKYLGTTEKWNYDIIVFGFWDCNASKDLSDSASTLVSQFLGQSGSAIFGHDTITKGCGNHVNFIKLQDYVGIETTKDLDWKGSNKVKIIKNGIFTRYPYKIGVINDVLTIPTSHVYGQIAKGDVWLSFEGIDPGPKNIYL